MPLPRKSIASSPLPARAKHLSTRNFVADIAAAVEVGVTRARDADTEREYLCRRAPNAIEWVIRPEFCNQPSLINGVDGGPPYWGTYEFIRDAFELRCPICNRGKTNMIGATKAQLESEILLTYSADIDDDVCPKCRTTRREFVTDRMMSGYHTAHVLSGMRSGKTYSSAYLVTYTEHILLTLAHQQKDHRGLQTYFGLAPSTQIDMAFVASSLKTNEESIWQAYRGMRNASPWFQRYTPWIKMQERLQDTPIGMQKWDYVENDNEVNNGAVRLVANAYAASSGTIVGRTRILGAADEIGRMKDTDSALGADEIYRGVEASLKTIRSAVTTRDLSLTWAGFMLSVSSPTSVHDKSMRLLKDAERVDRMYSMHRATWEFNPYQPRENFDEDFIKDPVGAERDFGANPPLAASPLIADRISFEESAVDWELKPTATFKTEGFTDPTGRAYLAIKLVHSELIRNGAPRFIAFDPGKSFDAFAGACAHGELDDEGRIVTVFDWIIRIVPEIGIEVWFDGVVDLVEAYRQSVTISRVEFDQWNSAQPMQMIRNLGIPSEESPTKDKHFIQFYRDAMAGRVKMLPPEEEDYDLVTPDKMSPTATALYELESLDRDIDGKITNPRKGLRRGYESDDVAHVVVHVHRLVQNVGFTEKYDDQSRRAKRTRTEAMMNEWSARGGGLIFRPGRLAGAVKHGGGGSRGW